MRNAVSKDSDVDTGHSLTVSAVGGGTVGSPVTGTYGSVTINTDGSYSYTLDNADGDTQALAQGATAADVFSYSLTNQHPPTATLFPYTTLFRSNDAPVANADSNAGDAVKES